MPNPSKMPARIWADPYFSHQQTLPGTTRDVAYIRADIAEQMAEALQKIADGLPDTRAPHRFSTAKDLAIAALTAWEASNG